MATKIQVIRLPDPVVTRPERIPEVSRPDPNVFMDEHFNQLLNLNSTMHAHTLHGASTRMASAQYGVPMDTMRGAQQAAASAAASADVTMGTAAGGAAPSGPAGGMAPSATPDVTMGQRDLGGAPGAAPPPAAPETAPPPGAAPATAPTPFDRPAFGQELIDHNIETKERQTREF